MTINKQNLEKKCCFYASDFHLEMTLVPYINKKIEENKEIVIVTQNNLEETVKILISKMNIKNKDEILKIDWNNNDVKQITSNYNLVVIVNGSKTFVENKNKELKDILKEKSIELVNCYSFEEIKNEIVEIRERHTEVLNNLQKNY